MAPDPNCVWVAISPGVGSVTLKETPFSRLGVALSDPDPPEAGAGPKSGARATGESESLTVTTEVVGSVLEAVCISGEAAAVVGTPVGIPSPSSMPRHELIMSEYTAALSAWQNLYVAISADGPFSFSLFCILFLPGIVPGVGPLRISVSKNRINARA